MSYLRAEPLILVGEVVPFDVLLDGRKPAYGGPGLGREVFVEEALSAGLTDGTGGHGGDDEDGPKIKELASFQG